MWLWVFRYIPIALLAFSDFFSAVSDFVQSCFRNLTVLSQICFSLVSDLLQSCLRFVTVLFQKFDSIVSDLLQSCPRFVTVLSQICYSLVSRSFTVQSCLRFVTVLSQICYSLVSDFFQCCVRPFSVLSQIFDIILSDVLQYCLRFFQRCLWILHYFLKLRSFTVFLRFFTIRVCTVYSLIFFVSDKVEVENFTDFTLTLFSLFGARNHIGKWRQNMHNIR